MRIGEALLLRVPPLLVVIQFAGVVVRDGRVQRSAFIIARIEERDVAKFDGGRDVGGANDAATPVANRPMAIEAARRLSQ